MLIDDAIAKLTELRQKHGNIELVGKDYGETYHTPDLFFHPEKMIVREYAFGGIKTRVFEVINGFNSGPTQMAVRIG